MRARCGWAARSGGRARPDGLRVSILGSPSLTEQTGNAAAWFRRPGTVVVVARLPLRRSCRTHSGRSTGPGPAGHLRRRGDRRRPWAAVVEPRLWLRRWGRTRSAGQDHRTSATAEPVTGGHGGTGVDVTGVPAASARLPSQRIAGPLINVLPEPPDATAAGAAGIRASRRQAPSKAP